MDGEERARELLDAIVNNPFIGVTIIDSQGYIIFRNKINEQISGIPNADVLGKHFSCIPGRGELLHVLHSGLPQLGVLYRTTRGASAIVHRFPLRDKDGRILGAMTIMVFENAMELQEVLEKYRILERKLTHYELELRKLRSAKYSLDQMIGHSRPLLRIKELVLRSAGSSAPVLILGETGTGKELCAHAVHLASERKNGPFIKVNCASIPRDLFEAELFGHEKGAFTDAKHSKVGKFELADGGTIFLDEISCLPIEAQAKLLRVLEDKEVERIGGTRPRKVDFRAIAATNLDLRALIKENRFREDLFYRLAVFIIEVPPLRERREDIPLLCQHFIREFNAEFGLRISGLEEEALSLLKAWPWPGNVRELKNVIERAVHLRGWGTVRVEDLPPYILDGVTAGGQMAERNPLRTGELAKAKRRLEKTLLESALIQSHWNKSRAARLLGISRPLLYALMRKHSLTPPSKSTEPA